ADPTSDGAGVLIAWGFHPAGGRLLCPRSANNARMKIIQITISILVAIFMLGFGWNILQPSLDRQRLVKEGAVKTAGEVTALEPNNHRTVHYKFVVGSQTY